MTAETDLLPLPEENVAHLIATQAAEIKALRAEVERVTCELMDAIAHAEKLAEASRQLVGMYERATGLPCPPQLRRAIAALRERLGKGAKS
jgi:ubiquinone biosynthesis protein UbiJ